MKLYTFCSSKYWHDSELKIFYIFKQSIYAYCSIKDMLKYLEPGTIYDSEIDMFLEVDGIIVDSVESFTLGVKLIPGTKIIKILK